MHAITKILKNDCIKNVYGIFYVVMINDNAKCFQAVEKISPLFLTTLKIIPASLIIPPRF